MLAATYTIPIEMVAEATLATSTFTGCLVTPRSAGRARSRTSATTSSSIDIMAEADELLASSDAEWPKLLRGHLRQLASLEAGWDGPGSARISRFALYTAGRITRRSLIGVENVVVPYLVPGGDGSVQIEWHEKRGELELAISPDGAFTLWGRDHLTGAEFEGEGESALALFARWAPRLAAGSDHAVHAPPPAAIPFVAFAA